MATRLFPQKLLCVIVILGTSFAPNIMAQPEQNLRAFSHFGGWPDGSVVRGDYAYLIQGTVLTVLDITGADFRRVASLTLPAEPADIIIQGDYVFLVVAGSDSAVQVVNIADPLKPNFIKRIAVKTDWPVRAFMADNFLYVVSNNVLQIIDATNPQEPVIAGSKEVPAMDIFVKGQLAFVGGSDGLHILDISNPAKVKQVSHVETPGINALCVQGDYAYLLGYRESSPKVVMNIFDITNTGNPSEVSNVKMTFDEWLSTSTPARMTVAGDFAYFGVKNRLVILYVAMPLTPLPAGIFEYAEGSSPNFQSLQVIPPFVYAAMGSSDFGFAKIDVSTPTEPVLATALKEPWDVTHFCAMDTKVYVASSERILIYDYSDPDNPVLAGQDARWPEQYRIYVDSTTLYGIDTAKLYIVDVSDPANMLEKGSYDLPAGKNPRSIKAFGFLAYLMTVAQDASESRLDILDVADPANIVLKGTFIFTGEGRDLFISEQDTIAYIAYDEGNVGRGLYIVDVHDPASPVLLGSGQTHAKPTCIWLSDTLAFVGNNDGGTPESNFYIEAFNVAHPSSPSQIGEAVGKGLVADLKVANHKVYASIYGGSVYQYNFTILNAYVVLDLIANCHSPASVFIAMIAIRNMFYTFTCDGAWSVDGLMASLSYGVFLQWVALNQSPVEIAGNAEAPAYLKLEQNYPNPFNPSTAIAFDVSEKGRVAVLVFDILGHKVATLVDGEYFPGHYKVNFNAENLPSGVYVCRMQVRNSFTVKKMLLLH
jgi:hypothetical protein